jgi:TonB family protein
VQTAQTLYASASYDEALAVLERLQHQDLTPSEVRVVHQQRALCLLALGRTQDANQAIAAAVQADPVYRHGEASASPRVRNAFRDVRARLLPGIVQSEYVEARRLYDTSSWAPAAAAFQRVVALATDGDLSEAQVKALADLRILADGFARLAATAATPPPPPEPVAPSPPPPPPVDYGRVFDSSDPEVVGPVTVRQDLPRWTAPSPVPRVIGLLEVIIAKNGVVERATLTRPISTAFDRQVLDGTKHWRYEPALVNGQPVRFKKTIKITFH